LADQGPGATQDARRAGPTRSSDRTRRDTVGDSGPAQRELLPDSKLYYRIGEVSRITGIKPHVLRYWETEFRWMAPPKSRSKQRLYRRKDIEMVLAIKKLLYDERYTIAGARQVIRERGVAKLLEDGVALETPGEEAKAVAAPSSDALGDDLPERIRGLRRELLALRSILA
jgi:DNA-binding transcriptional MerR regulator